MGYVRTKSKPLRSLFFQFLRGTEFEHLAVEHVAKILSDAGLIELILNKYDETSVTHYKETEVMRNIPAEIFEAEIASLIRESFKERKARNGNK